MRDLAVYGSGARGEQGPDSDIEIRGEAAGKLPTEARDLAPEIPWDAMIGMRHRIAHAYFGIDNDILWDVVENEVPLLAKAIARVQANSAGSRGK